MTIREGIAAETLVWVLGSLCRQHRISFIPNLLSQRVYTAATEAKLHDLNPQAAPFGFAFNCTFWGKTVRDLDRR